MEQRKIGVVIPVYNAEKSIGRVAEELIAYFKASGLSYQLILVDDGSVDGSIGEIFLLARQNPNVMAVQLSRNFGQQNALLCGLALAVNCRYIITMDDDLQHPSQVIEALYQKICEGFDLVYAIPEHQCRPLYRRLGSGLRDMLFALFASKPRGIRVSSYRIMTAALASKICAERQPFVYLSASAFRYGPRTANIPYRPKTRAFGRSGYTLMKLARLYYQLFFWYTASGRLFSAHIRRGVPYEILSIVKGADDFE